MTRPAIADGTLEALKWLALVLMTGDHVDKYLFNGTIEALYAAGRGAMPLFVFVLAYNLARPGALENGAYLRTLMRLTLAGLAATPPFIALGGLAAGWWPLNILFMLAALTAILYLVEGDRPGGYLAAAAVFGLGGALVEFWWPGLALGVAVWGYCKKPNWAALVLAITALLSLWFVNGNQWALVVIPAILASFYLELPLPRLSGLFYAYYPIHLAALWLIRIPMSHAGYLFF
jgi:hypothetical protein